MTRDEFLAIDPKEYTQQWNYENHLSNEEVSSLAPEINEFIMQFKMNKSEKDEVMAHFKGVYLSYAPIVRLTIWTRIAQDPNHHELMRRAHRIMADDLIRMLLPSAQQLAEENQG